MILTTTNGIDGRQVTRYHGIVTAEVILGANVFRDMFAGVRDFIGGRSGSYEKPLCRAREMAMEELEAEARDKGANAVIGVDIDYEVIGEHGSMMMVSVSGTAVTVS
jgi:uncharacterized protein YbjQ (UPF0145 family)